jgi:hypothetical protein
LTSALRIARDHHSPLTATLIEMALLNEASDQATPVPGAEFPN